MEQEITNYLRETFNPSAIILHGSRASGHERPHSDWDIVLLYNTATIGKINGRLIYEEQNIEYSHHQTPVQDVMKEFGVKLQNARVLWEEGGVGRDLLSDASHVYAAGLQWTDEERYSHSLWMRSRIDGMQDAVDSPLLFEKYATDFYSRITNYWYWAIHDQYPKPMYLALEEIKEADPLYYELIERFALSHDRSDKVKTAKEIYSRCF